MQTATSDASGVNGPTTDLLSFAFDALPLPDDGLQPLYVDAVDPSCSLNARQFRLLVRSLIAGLKAHNVQKGDCVLVNLGNCVLYPALFFAIIGAGGVYMGSNHRNQPHELEHIISLGEPKLIVTSRDVLPVVLDVSAGQGMRPSQVCVLESVSDLLARFFPSSAPEKEPLQPLQNGVSEIVVEKEPGENLLEFVELLCHGESDWIRFDDEVTARTTPAALYTTSGTGGLPKAAILSHSAIVSQHLSCAYNVPYQVTRLMSLPMFHLFGALFAHISPIRYGHPLYVLSRFDIETFARCVSRYQISETYMVPAMIHTYNRYSVSASFPVKEHFSSLRYVAVAGAPIDADAMQQFRALLQRDASACQLWGMTEAGIAFQCRYPEQGHFGSIGRITPGYEVCLVDSQGRHVASEDVVGELHVRGPGLLLGYKGRDDAKDRHGWFRTGDVAYVRDGYYYIVGRTKELIKVRGWQVPPAELESVLLTHPFIEDAAVTGVTSRDGTSEVPRAFVVRAKTPQAQELTAEEVYNFSRSRLASYKALDGGVIFVEEIPRTASGKIQRFKLSQMNSYREIMASLLNRFEVMIMSTLRGIVRALSRFGFRVRL